MKKTIYSLKAAALLAIVAAMPVVTACSDDDGEGGGAGEAARLTVVVAEGDGTSPLDEGLRLGMFMTGGDGASVVSAVMTAGAGGQLAGADAITAAMQDGMTLAAFTPADLWTAANYGQAVQFSVQTDQSAEAAYRASDLMMSPLTPVSGGKAALVMEHKMTKVSVHVTDVTGLYDLTQASMAMPSCLTTVDADLVRGTVTTVEGVTADITCHSPGNSPYRASARAIVAPGPVAAGAVLTSLAVDGQTFTYSLPEGAEWQGGKEYVYSMRLTNEGLVPYDSYVTDWKDNGEDLSGDAEKQ